MARILMSVPRISWLLNRFACSGGGDNNFPTVRRRLLHFLSGSRFIFGIPLLDFLVRLQKQFGGCCHSFLSQMTDTWLLFVTFRSLIREEDVILSDVSVTYGDGAVKSVVDNLRTFRFSCELGRMKSEIGQQLRSRRITTSTDQSLEEDSMDSALKISPNLTPEFDHHHQEFEGKISDGGIDEKKTTTTSVSTLPCLVAQDETAAKISSLGQLDATADDDDGFKTPTDLAHRIPTPTECPPAPKIKKRPYDYSPVNSAAVRSRSCRRKLVFDGFDLMARLKIQEDEDMGIHLCSLNN